MGNLRRPDVERVSWPARPVPPDRRHMALEVEARQARQRAVIRSVRTDRDGRYTMPRPCNGRYVVTVAAPKGQMGARAITVPDTTRDVDLVLGTPLEADSALY
jgi:Carboxypeptidase regulatory-like domain